MSQTPALEYDDVSKSYGDVRALDHVDLRLEPGDFLGLLGPNGAGKTTAIHLACGLAKLREGSIRVFGHDVIDEYRQARRLIGIAPQEPNFDRFFSVIDGLVYQGGYFGIDAATSRRRALRLLEFFELADKKNARPPQLSGGQKRRLLLAKALIHDPRLVILDEPTAGLDVVLRHKLWDYLRELKERGKTILLTTHYVEEVEALADRVAILNRGELVLEDTMQDVMEHYGRYQWIFEVDRLPDDAARLLEQKYSFLQVEDSTLRANRRHFQSEIGEILETLREQQVSLRGLRFEQTPLEDIFLDQVREPS